jgi:hypothetical protein
MEKYTRLSIDIPNEMHRKLKSITAIHGLSMRELLLDAVEVQIRKLEKELDKQKESNDEIK